MKNGILILLSGLLGAVLLAVVITIGGNINRSVELQGNLSGAVEESIVESRYRDEKVQADEMIEECVAQMAVAVDSDMGIEFRVYQEDAEKGILSVCAVGDYLHLNGTQGDTAWERTAIYELNGKDEMMSSYSVRFYENKELLAAQGDCYKEYEVLSGSNIVEPHGPKKEGQVFVGWLDMNDYVADFSQPIIQDISYYAVWE